MQKNQGNRHFIRSLATGVFILFFSFLSEGAWAQNNRVSDIRFWQSPEEAQIVVDLTFTPRISPVSALTDGTCFFDVEGCSFRPGHQTYTLNNAFLNTLTIQERISGSIRVYFKVPEGVRQRTFFLPKSAQKPDRIVIFLGESAKTQMQRRSDEMNEVNRLKAGGIKIVVLDPGHGGEDPGACHGGIIEKNYVLGMAQLVKSFFDRDPHYRAVITRTGDYIIPLEQRSKIAERLGADSFVSIHANYNSKRAVRGIEVYYESYHGAVGQAELLVAESENQQDDIGGVDVTQVSNPALSDIVAKQASIMFKSSQLAEKVDRRLAVAVPGLISRGVKRAGFKVLHSTSLPSILVEVGYMSNPTDCAYLKHQPSQQRLAQGIYQGIKDFLENKIQEGVDSSYLQYAQAIETEKQARAAQIRAARARREKLIKNSQSYKVKSGDTLPKLAKHFSVNLNDLCEVNGLGKKQKLKAGATLRIPRG